jgi:hypothetical protein
MAKLITRLLVTACFTLAPACVPDIPRSNEECRFRCEKDHDCMSGFSCRNGLCASSPSEECWIEQDGGAGTGDKDGD